MSSNHSFSSTLADFIHLRTDWFINARRRRKDPYPTASVRSTEGRRQAMAASSSRSSKSAPASISTSPATHTQALPSESGPFAHPSTGPGRPTTISRSLSAPMDQFSSAGPPQGFQSPSSPHLYHHPGATSSSRPQFERRPSSITNSSVTSSVGARLTLPPLPSSGALSSPPYYASSFILHSPPTSLPGTNTPHPYYAGLLAPTGVPSHRSSQPRSPSVMHNDLDGLAWYVADPGPPPRGGEGGAGSRRG
jgi:hypothetical protein